MAKEVINVVVFMNCMINWLGFYAYQDIEAEKGNIRTEQPLPYK